MKKIPVLVGLFFLLGLFGCSKEPAPVQSNQAVDPGEPGVVQIPEPARDLLDSARIGVPEMITNMATWPIDSLPPSLMDTSYDIYAVTLLWGQLLPVPNSEAMDWSGTLGVNAEAIVHVLAPIDFESGQDSILPHDAVHFAAWTSITQGDLDGVACLIFLKRGNEYFAAPWLSLETAPFSKTWEFGLLDRFAAWYPVEPNAGVAIFSRKLDINRCPSGTFDGTWVKSDNSGDSGWFGGTWYDPDGSPEFSYAGQFWTNNDGSREFHGYISGYILTVVLGEMHGSWYYDDPSMCPMCGEGHGIMHGTYQLGNNTEHQGKVIGAFGRYTLPIDSLTLPLTGVWRENCPGFSKWYTEDE